MTKKHSNFIDFVAETNPDAHARIVSHPAYDPEVHTNLAAVHSSGITSNDDCGSILSSILSARDEHGPDYADTMTFGGAFGAGGPGLGDDDTDDFDDDDEDEDLADEGEGDKPMSDDDKEQLREIVEEVGGELGKSPAEIAEMESELGVAR